MSKKGATDNTTSLIVYRDQKPLFTQVVHAKQFHKRLRGLLFQPTLRPNQGLMLTPCFTVHTLAMRISIDVVFLDHRGFVTKCVHQLAPWRYAGSLLAAHALELAAGSIVGNRIHPGQQLNW